MSKQNNKEKMFCTKQEQSNKKHPRKYCQMIIKQTVNILFIKQYAASKHQPLGSLGNTF